MWRVCLSQGGALRAYPELLTTESLRLPLMVELLLYQGQTAPHRGASWEGAILSPHGALRAYTVLLTAEPRRGSLMM